MNEWEREGNRGYGPSHSVPYPHEAPAGLPPKKKWIAGWLAFFIPGTGHLYLGQMVKGIVIMFLIVLNIFSIALAVIEDFPVLIVVLMSLLLPIIYFYSLFDAIQSADLVNYRWRYSAWQAHMFGPPGASAPVSHRYGQPPSFQPQAAHENAPAFGDQATAGPAVQPHAEYADGFAGNGAASPGAANLTPPPQRESWPITGPLNAPGALLLGAAVVALILIAGFGSSGWIFRSAGSVAGAAVLIIVGMGLWLWEWKGDRKKGS